MRLTCFVSLLCTSLSGNGSGKKKGPVLPVSAASGVVVIGSVVVSLVVCAA